MIFGGGIQKTSTYIGTLSNFEASSITATLSSSSSIIADAEETLTVTVTPSTVMLANGGLVIYFPDYYENSGSDQMIS